MDALNTIYVSYYPDGSFEVYSDDDPDGVRVEFDNAAKDWSLPKKHLEAYNDFLKKKFGPHEDLL